MSLLSKEPAAVSGVVPSLVALAVSFGLDLSADQVAGILGVLPVLLALWVRSRVSPVKAPKEPPSDKTPPTGTVLPVACLAFVLLAVGCSGSGEAPTRLPNEAEMRKLCPELIEASTLKCAEIAVKHCQGFDSLNECPNGEKARAECEALRSEEASKCR